MNISAACLPPIQPPVSDVERQHPRYREYETYRAALSRQLVTAPLFSTWLRSREQFENGFECVYEVTPGARLRPGWYKNKFPPRERDPIHFGPFATKAEAEAA